MYAYVHGISIYVRACVRVCSRASRLCYQHGNTIYVYVMDLDEFNITREKSIDSRVKIRRSISLA